MSSKLSPAQRAALFAQQTRQYIQELPAMTFTEGQTISCTLPKTRFLSKVTLKVKGTFKITHASTTTLTKAVFAPYRILKQVRLSMNNGFNPFQLSGVGLYLYNLANKYAAPSADPFAIDNLTVVGATTPGGSNTIHFNLDLPLTLNDRDPVGMIMLQNEQTVVTLSIDCGNLVDMYTDSATTAGTISITITPVIETFSIPNNPDAIPDFSVIKIVNEQIEDVLSVGDKIIKMPVGLTYRKLINYICSDASVLTATPHANLNNFSLVFNQADTPYQMSADHIAYQNKKAYAGQLPLGCYALDFSSQGVPNLGGSRDYIDTERLTEFWQKINFGTVSKTNYVRVVSEKLARVI